MRDKRWVVLFVVVCFFVGFYGEDFYHTRIDIAALEQTVAELQTKVKVLEEQQQQGLRAVLGCTDDEAVCFVQHEEQNEHGLPGRAWTEMWCCPGPGK